jgi:Leucine-rich repeat (LRR) protein
MIMRKIALLALAVILAIVLVGCAGGEEADKTAPTISGVSASDITQTSATITWTTDEPAGGEVEYGLTTSYGSTALQLLPALITSHSVPLSDLDENTTYHYRVKSKDEAGNEAVSGDYTFTTMAVPNEPPNQPSNLSPSDGTTGVSLTPTLESSDFYDPEGDIHASSTWQITTVPGDYSNPVFDSDLDTDGATDNLTSIAIPSGTLSHATTYYWHVRYGAMNHDWGWSEWSEETSFTTLIFPDENLEEAVREAIDKPEGALLISDLEGLSYLDASRREIADLTGLEHCINLTELGLFGNQISDISPLENLTALTWLRLDSNQIIDISPLADLTSLTYLNLYGNEISDVTTVSNLTSLTTLKLYLNQISDITPVSNLTSLTEIELGNNQIIDIAPLSNLTGLTELQLYLNQISDLSPLSNLTNLTILYLSGNQISDITPLSNLADLSDLRLDNNEISDISPLVDNEGIAEGDVVELRGNPLSAESLCTLIPQLEDRGVEVLYDEPQAVTFPDANLEAAIREAVGKPEGAIDICDLQGLTELYANEMAITNLTGLEHCTKLLDLRLSDNQITDLTALEHLTSLTYLFLRNNQIQDISPLSNLTQLIVLWLSHNQITDFTLISSFANLEMLNLDNSQITDISFVSSLTSLTYLSLNDNLLSDISTLGGLTTLSQLYLRNNQIADITPLVDNDGLAEGDTVDLQANPLNSESLCTLIPQLEARGVEVLYDEPQVVTFPDANLEAAIREAVGKPEGDINVCDLEVLIGLGASGRNITSIAGLEYCTKLTTLRLQNNQISDLSPLSGLTSLTVLYLYDNQISDLSPLSSLTSLTELLLSGNQITDLSPLSGLTSLTELTLYDNQIADLSPLSGLTSLTELALGNNQISDLSPLPGLTSLMALYLSDNQITDLSPLSGLTSLTGLYLWNNQIADLSPLSGLTSLTELNLAGNQISDLSPLSGLTSLTALALGNNQISDISPLVDNEGLSAGDQIELGGNPLSAESINTLIPQLEARGVTVLYDTP